MKPTPLTDDEVRDLRQIREAYRAGRMLMLCIIGLGAVATAITSVFATIHWK